MCLIVKLEIEKSPEMLSGTTLFLFVFVFVSYYKRKLNNFVTKGEFKPRLGIVNHQYRSTLSEQEKVKERWK